MIKERTMSDHATWAESLCDKESRALAGQPSLKHSPHALAGMDLVMTTTGACCLLLPAAEWSGRDLGIYEDAHGLMSLRRAQPIRHTMGLGAILAWAGEPVHIPCDCGGKSVDCDECWGSGQHECGCGNEHDCDECEGIGKTVCDRCIDGLLPLRPRSGLVAATGPLVDRNLFHRLLHGCPDPPDTPVGIGWNAGSDSIVLRGPVWTGIVMHIRDAEWTGPPLIGEGPADVLP